MADYTQTYINNDMSKLNTVLQTLVTNGIVGAVDYDSSGEYAVFTFYADAEKTTEVFRITQGTKSGYVTYRYTFTATAADGATLSSTADGSNGSSINNYIIMYGYSCANGIMIGLNGYSSNSSLNVPVLWFIITKNQNGAPVFIWTNQPSTGSLTKEMILTTMNTEYIVASTDVAPLGTVSRVAPAVRNQVQIAPFVTCCAAGDISYTPDAGRVIAGDMNSYLYDPVAHEINFASATWLTNGYWALKVG